MLTDRDLQELLAYQAQSPVLSVYLNTDPVEGNADAHKLRLRSMLKDVNLAEDVNASLHYFEFEHDWSGRSVALFSCAPEAFLKAYSLAVPIRSRVRIDNHPHVKPLADLLDSYGGYGVVLVDKQGARLFSFHLGELKEQEGVMGESVRRTKRGGGSQSPGRRGGSTGQTNYVGEVTDRNIKEAVDFSTRFFTENNVRRILIGGTEDTIALFRGQLPKAWQSLVVGTFPMSMTASHSDVLDKAMQLGQEAELLREERLVNTLVTNAAKGRGGVIGLDDTLKAIHEGRVQTLVIQEGYRAPGWRCKSCGYVSAVELEYCPYCGGESQTIPDAVELVVRKVMEGGGEVEVLHSDQVVLNFNQIGAILRY
jgi:peptide subunit release factor 1 (eRF1)